MTYLDSSPSPKSFPKTAHWPLLALCLLLAACAADETSPGGEHRHRDSSLSNKFEWGVQYYESGKYAEALKTFERLRENGAEVPEFDLIPYYTGMTYLRMGRFEDAARELETFLKKASTREESQDARIALLLAYEQLSRWGQINALAAETDQLTLYQNNRALLKLLWARALREQGEMLGAKAALTDALPYLDKIGPDEGMAGWSGDPNQDLWGRYHFTHLLVEQLACNASGPKELPAAGKKAHGQKLYSPWLESVTDCYRKAVTEASDELFSRDSRWNAAAASALEAGIVGFGQQVQAALHEEHPRLERFRKLQGNAREQLYRLLGTVDAKIKNFKNRGLATTHLNSLRKQIDRLLVTISSPS